MEEKFIGFLKVLEKGRENGGQNSYVGAILVTDLKSVPVEFRVTLPVTPTSIQKSLYGNSMMTYIGTELCGTQLLNTITHELEFLFVDPIYMLDLRSKNPAPTFFLQSGENLEGTLQEKKWYRIGDDMFQTIQLTANPEFADDYDHVRTILDEVSSRFDVVEPFQRIDKALDVLAVNDNRFKV